MAFAANSSGLGRVLYAQASGGHNLRQPSGQPLALAPDQLWQPQLWRDLIRDVGPDGFLLSPGCDAPVNAKQLGAVAAIVEHELSSVDLPQIVVENSVAALGQLAKAVLAQVRAETGLKVIGITGSNGKE